MRRVIGSVLTVFAIQTFVIAQAAGQKYVGYTYKDVIPGKTLPNGVKYLGGGMITDIHTEPVWGISEVARGNTRMLWLERSTGSNEQGITGWQVKDVLVFPNFTGRQHLFYSLDPSIFCRKGGKDVENLVAVGQIVRRQGTYRVQRGWTANVKSGKFEAASLAGLRCEYSEP